MKLRAKLNDQDHALTIECVEDLTIVQVDGRKYELRIREPEDGCYLILVDTYVYEASVSAVRHDLETLEVSLRGRSYPITIVDPRRLRSSQTSERHHHGATEIRAQMPGKVVRVLVDLGAEVSKGAGIVVVEAMKMQNEMKSPRAGIVGLIRVSPGDTVARGDLLAVVE
jgi:biotin carboxyl carrier protein